MGLQGAAVASVELVLSEETHAVTNVEGKTVTNRGWEMVR